MYGLWTPWVSPPALSGVLEVDQMPKSKSYSFVIFSVKVVCEKSDQFNSQVKCTCAFPWDNYSVCSRLFMDAPHFHVLNIKKMFTYGSWWVKNASVWYSVTKCFNIGNIYIIHWIHISKWPRHDIAESLQSKR